MSEQTNARAEAQELPEQIDLTRILDGMWKALRHYFWIVILLTLLGAVLFFVRAKINYVPQYLSSATFTVSADSQNIYSSNGYYNNATASQLESTFPYLLTSGTLSRVVAADLGVEQLNGSITASVMPKTNLFTIEVRSGDPQAASDILNSLIENYPVVAEQVVGSTVLLVTSAAPGEGKSTVAANIAMALAMNGKKVLLMDCDIRNPSVGGMLGLRPGKGVCELLKGETTLDEVFQYDKAHSLYVLPGGKPYANASEILDAPQMAQLLASVRELVDYVILDTAPVGMLTDTAVLAELADGALFVVKQDYAPIPHLVDAAEQLAESRIPLLGCILNGATATLGSYGQSYYSSYHHYSRYGGYGGQEETPAQSKSRAKSPSRQRS